MYKYWTSSIINIYGQECMKQLSLINISVLNISVVCNTSPFAFILTKIFWEKTEQHTKIGKGEYGNIQHKAFNFWEKIKLEIQLLLIDWEP